MRGRNGLVARHDALDQAAHGLDAERQRNHVEQQQVAARGCCRPAGWPGWRRPAPPLRRGSGWSAARGRKTSPRRAAPAACGWSRPPSPRPGPRHGQARRRAGPCARRSWCGRSGAAVAASKSAALTSQNAIDASATGGQKASPMAQRTRLPCRRAPPSCRAALSDALSDPRSPRSCASTQSASAWS